MEYNKGLDHSAEMFAALTITDEAKKDAGLYGKGRASVAVFRQAPERERWNILGLTHI